MENQHKKITGYRDLSQEDSDTDSNLWNGECGAVWEFIADGPAENKCNFFPECGGKLVIA